MAKLKKTLIFALCLLPIAIVAGIFVGFYQLEVYPDETIAEITAELGSTSILIVVGVLQTAGYALFCGFFGHILADKIGLWKPIRFEKTPLFVTLAVSLCGGILFSLDYWTFGKWIEPVRASYAAGITANNLITSVLYGGIIEEVMMRLFFMSLIAMILWKVFCRKYDCNHIPAMIFAAANIIAALGFAAGHLPSTYLSFGSLPPLVLFRCFLLNGAFGLIFGWLYRKYGIGYAMLGHSLFHIVCKVILLVFL